jgi:1,4-dihydroxy-2-naphthoyl-CoA synthase
MVRHYVVLLKCFITRCTKHCIAQGKPVIAAVNGHARAAGVTWAVSSDMIIAAEEAQMGCALRESHVGLLPAMHLVHLPRIAGRHRAAELLFTGDIRFSCGNAAPRVWRTPVRPTRRSVAARSSSGTASG